MSEIKIFSLTTIGNKKSNKNDISTKDRTDPKYIGPGTWDTLTRLAVKAITNKLEKEFKREMTETCENFPCHICAGHCKKYIEENPIEKNYGKFIIVDGKKFMIGMFMWIWKFHNAVNARLNKNIMSWDTAYNMYYTTNELFCSAACMDAEHQEPDVPKKIKK